MDLVFLCVICEEFEAMVYLHLTLVYYRFERHAVLPKFLGARIEAWRPEACFYNADSILAGTARRALPTGSIDAYTVLVSLGGRRLAPRGPYIHYTEDACILY